MDIETLYNKTVEVLRLAAAPGDIQLSVFPKETCRPDEIALTIDEILSDSKLLLDSKKISLEMFERFMELNSFYLDFDKNDWTEKAVLEADDWEKSRQIARTIIADLNIEIKKPNLFWMTYVL